jgi:predicted negative regulator of RcsB-dependent stress response
MELTLPEIMIIVIVASAVLAGFQQYSERKKAKKEAESKAYKNKAYKANKRK